VTRRPAELGPHELLVDLADVPLVVRTSTTSVAVPFDDGATELTVTLDPDYAGPPLVVAVAGADVVQLDVGEALGLAYALLALVREHDRLELAERLSAAGQAATSAALRAELADALHDPHPATEPTPPTPEDRP
jgi:hypothetical protein